jgi:hypothetical protein
LHLHSRHPHKPTKPQTKKKKGKKNKNKTHKARKTPKERSLLTLLPPFSGEGDDDPKVAAAEAPRERNIEPIRGPKSEAGPTRARE